MQTQILKNLEDVDWVGLQAVDIPKWLKGLASPDPKIRTDAYSNLQWRLAFQESDDDDYGSLSVLLRTEMPVFVVPFLIELLGYQDVKSKNHILEILRDLATYVRLDADSEVYRSRAHKIYNTVLQGIDVYKSLLSDTSPAVKMGAALLLDELGEKL